MPIAEVVSALEPALEVKNEWPEPEEATAGGPGGNPTESAKRKRRRRKGKGAVTSSNAIAPEAAADETSHVQAPAAATPAVPPPRPRVDPALLTKMAWKIFLAEVSEEGVALISDNDAKDLSRRCFRLAEIFVEEQSRRR